MIYHDILWLSHDILVGTANTRLLGAFAPAVAPGHGFHVISSNLTFLCWPNWNLWWNSKFGTLRYCLFFRKHPWKSKEKWSWNIGHVQAVTTIPLDLSLPYRSLGTNGTRNGGRHSSVSFVPINWTTVTHSWILMKCRVRWHKLFLGFFPLLYSMTIASNMVVPLRTAATKHFLVVSTLFLSLKLSCSSV